MFSPSLFFFSVFVVEHVIILLFLSYYPQQTKTLQKQAITADNNVNTVLEFCYTTSRQTARYQTLFPSFW